LQVFDKHDGVVFADVVRRLVYEVLSDIGNLGVQLVILAWPFQAAKKLHGIHAVVVLLPRVLTRET